MRTVVVLSGGMDSAVLLASLIEQGRHVFAVTVNYGQRHVREIDAAQAICDHYTVPLVTVQLSELADVMLGSSQTDRRLEVPEGHYAEPSMKLTVVPNRNMLLLAIAGAHAVSIGADSIAYGAHAGDHAIYPDCRPAFIDAMRAALALCHYTPVLLEAPFSDLDKGDIADLGVSLGVPFEFTWTCYKGGDVHCGRCGACCERIEAFAKHGHRDPAFA